MDDIYTNLYRLVAVILVVFLFFVTGRPYFNYKIRIFVSAITAGVLNGFGGGALLGTSLDGIPLRFVVALVAVGAGVAILEYIFPEGGTRRHLRS